MLDGVVSLRPGHWEATAISRRACCGATRGTRRAQYCLGVTPTMSRVKRLLVPTDFSPTSDIAFNYALDMAARERASIHLLHVIEDASFAAAYPDGLSVEPPGRRGQVIAEAERQLRKAVMRAAAAGVVATTQVIVGSPASSMITAVENEWGSDLIVMGTHGRTGLAHFVLGSVAERVLRTAHCPVLTVRDWSRAADIITTDTVILAAPGRRLSVASGFTIRGGKSCLRRAAPASLWRRGRSPKASLQVHHMVPGARRLRAGQPVRHQDRSTWHEARGGHTRSARRPTDYRRERKTHADGKKEHYRLCERSTATFIA